MLFDSFFADDFSADLEQVNVRYSKREQVGDDFSPYFHDQKRLYEMRLNEKRSVSSLVNYVLNVDYRTGSLGISVLALPFGGGFL